MFPFCVCILLNKTNLHSLITNEWYFLTLNWFLVIILLLFRLLLVNYYCYWYTSCWYNGGAFIHYIERELGGDDGDGGDYIEMMIGDGTECRLFLFGCFSINLWLHISINRFYFFNCFCSPGIINFEQSQEYFSTSMFDTFRTLFILLRLETFLLGHHLKLHLDLRGNHYVGKSVLLQLYVNVSSQLLLDWVNYFW